MTKKIEKAKYEAPRLTVFGSVRNLTGGSGSNFRDGAITNVQF
jgi:hypothetical protein